MKQEIANINRQAREIRNIRLELEQELAVLDGPKVGDTTVVEHWNGSRWIEKKLIWNGQAYVDDIVTDYQEYGKCWQAWLDGTEDSDRSATVGYGHTEKAAIEDLIEQLEDK